MAITAERVLEDLQKVLTEIDELAKRAATEMGKSAGEHSKGLQETIASARGRLSNLQETLGRDLKKGVRTADNYVHDNAWASIGTAAVAAFLAGFIIGRPRS